MRRFAFYNEFLARQGFKWFAAVSFWVDSELWLLSIQRTMREGPFEAIDKCTLSQLSRPLADVASLSTAVGRIALSSVTNALNLVCQPAIAIDRFGFVLDANAGAEALFDAHIRVKSKRLSERPRLTPGPAVRSRERFPGIQGDIFERHRGLLPHVGNCIGTMAFTLQRLGCVS